MTNRRTTSLLKAVIILFFISGCITTGRPIYSVKQNYDEFSKAATHRMVGNCIASWGMYCDNYEWHGIYLNAAKWVKDGLTSYGIIVKYHSSFGWLFIESGESLIFLADGEKIGLTGSGSLPSREAERGGYVTEFAIYPITPEQLKRVAFAKEVKVRIVGSYNSDHILKEDNLKNFQQFYNEYVK